MSRQFILDKDHNVIPTDLYTWGMFLEHSSERIVGQVHVGRFWVSTVFLGLDHDFAGVRLTEEYGGMPLGFYQPKVFETMVFYRERHEITFGRHKRMVREEFRTVRYRTWDEAAAGHARTVKLITRYERMLAYHEAHAAK